MEQRAKEEEEGATAEAKRAEDKVLKGKILWIQIRIWKIVYFSYIVDDGMNSDKYDAITRWWDFFYIFLIKNSTGLFVVFTQDVLVSNQILW